MVETVPSACGSTSTRATWDTIVLNERTGSRHSCGKRILHRAMKEFDHCSAPSSFAEACSAVATKYDGCSACMPPVPSVPGQPCSASASPLPTSAPTQAPTFMATLAPSTPPHPQTVCKERDAIVSSRSPVISANGWCMEIPEIPSESNCSSYYRNKTVHGQSQIYECYYNSARDKCWMDPTLPCPPPSPTPAPTPAPSPAPTSAPTPATTPPKPPSQPRPPCTPYTLILETKTSGSEIAWSVDGMSVPAWDRTASLEQGSSKVIGQNYGDNAKYPHYICLEDGAHTLACLDSFGDGWPGGYMYFDGFEGVTYCALFTSGKQMSANFYTPLAMAPVPTPAPTPAPTRAPSSAPPPAGVDRLVLGASKKRSGVADDDDHSHILKIKVGH